jgi:hypothetical protein
MKRIALLLAAGCLGACAATDPLRPIGIASCDEMIRIHKACLAPSLGPESRQAFEDVVATWRDMATRPAERTVLQVSCSASLAAGRIGFEALCPGITR